MLTFTGSLTPNEQQTIKHTFSWKHETEKWEATYSNGQYGLRKLSWAIPHWERSLNELMKWYMGVK